MVLAERLRRKIEKKKMLPEKQAGFRKGRNRAIDNIYTLNYVVERVVRRNKIVTTLDMNAAFDSLSADRVIGKKFKKERSKFKIKKKNYGD